MDNSGRNKADLEGLQTSSPAPHRANTGLLFRPIKVDSCTGPVGCSKRKKRRGSYAKRRAQVLTGKNPTTE